MSYYDDNPTEIGKPDHGSPHVAYTRTACGTRTSAWWEASLGR